MKPSAPTKFIWLLAIILGVVGIVANFVSLGVVSEYSYWLLVAGYGLFFLGTSFKGL